MMAVESRLVHPVSGVGDRSGHAQAGPAAPGEEPPVVLATMLPHNVSDSAIVSAPRCARKEVAVDRSDGTGEAVSPPPPRRAP